MSIMLDEMFKVPLFKVKLDRDKVKLRKEVIEQRASFSEGQVVSNQGGWQSPNTWWNEGELGLLSNDLTSHGAEIAQTLGVDATYWVIGWINVNGYQHFNWEHTHPGCLISGVYYLTVPDQSGILQFIHPACESMGGGVVNTRSPYYTPTCDVQPEENCAYFFPGWVRHRVLPNLNPLEERVSIAFNIGCM